MQDATETTSPKHVAIIMDGNGRWAEAKGLPRSKGHEAGALSVKTIVEESVRHGVKFLTLYSFSTENWTRPQGEIDALMQLLLLKLASEVPELIKQGICLKHIGRKDRFSQEVQAAIDAACTATASGETLTVCLALDYSGRSELVNAVKKLVGGGIAAENLTEEAIQANLYTAGVPDPDLLIRTAGEFRISNFLLWQIAYSEIYIADCCWPDFGAVEFNQALESYSNRNRTFGSLK